MQRGLWIRLIVIILLGAGAAWVVQPRPIRLLGKTVAVKEGLDLKGGTHLVYALETGEIDPNLVDQAHESIVKVIRNRIDSYGVSEPLIQIGTIGETRTVIVELPGVADVFEAKNLIGRTAQLTFWEIDEAANDLASPLGPGWQKTELTGAHLERADVDIQSGASGGGSGRTEPIINLTFSSEGAELFRQITARNVQKPVAIVLDDQLISAPTVQQEISGGQAIITGVGNVREAKQLSIQLNAGALPIPIQVIEERNVGATLGSTAVERSLVAGLVGLLIIAIFMIALYGVPGVLAVLALMLYTLVTFGLFKLIPVTITLAGIAGFILSIGMAVDANILIFERLKEERRAGRSLQAAIDEGFRRAWTSVRDSNVSSLITAAILFYFGSGLVRGFALTLAIGILVSMFTAITVTRTLLKLALRENNQ
ncbi:protein translocase subunit SecD [Candidatus Berkelbacteria bacterium]|nr:protein translocase subunit SecD [Candidatus Berkelbacteria bacterium]